jgi:hypothetical protein
LIQRVVFSGRMAQPAQQHANVEAAAEQLRRLGARVGVNVDRPDDLRDGIYVEFDDGRTVGIVPTACVEIRCFSGGGLAVCLRFPIDISPADLAARATHIFRGVEGSWGAMPRQPVVEDS